MKYSSSKSHIGNKIGNQVGQRCAIRLAERTYVHAILGSVNPLILDFLYGNNLFLKHCIIAADAREIRDQTAKEDDGIALQRVFFCIQQ